MERMHRYIKRQIEITTDNVNKAIAEQNLAKAHTAARTTIFLTEYLQEGYRLAEAWDVPPSILDEYEKKDIPIAEAPTLEMLPTDISLIEFSGEGVENLVFSVGENIEIPEQEDLFEELNFAQSLQLIRGIHDVTLEAIAKKVDIRVETVRDYVREDIGKRHIPRPETLDAIIEALGISNDHKYAHVLRHKAEIDRAEKRRIRNNSDHSE
jgi:hypothetical protein